MAKTTGDPLRPRPTDTAVFATDPYGGRTEPTYGGVTSFMRRRITRDLAGVDVAILGIPFDAAVTNRSGARFGPQAIRRASAIFEGDPQYPFHADIFEHLAVVDYGDAVWDFGRPWEAHRLIQGQAAEVIAAGCHLFSLGGDHSVTWPLLAAHAAAHGPLALVHFDAHQDTWEDDGERIDHGSFVLRAVRQGVIDPARSIQVGIRTHAPFDCGIEILYAHEIDDCGIAGIAERIARRVGVGKAYMTFDIDCLDPAFAPGTGTPASGGFSSREALAILKRACEACDFVGGDVVEVAPAYDHADITAIAASTVAQVYLGSLAAKRRR